MLYATGPDRAQAGITPSKTEQNTMANCHGSLQIGQN
jgi:hypothetical protein